MCAHAQAVCWMSLDWGGRYGGMEGYGDAVRFGCSGLDWNLAEYGGMGGSRGGIRR